MAWTIAHTTVTAEQDPKFHEEAKKALEYCGKDYRGRKVLFFVDSEDKGGTWIELILTDKGISIEWGEPAA
jgi:hypothetical protein